MAGSQTIKQQWVYSTSDHVRRQWKQTVQVVRGSEASGWLVVELILMAKESVDVSLD